MVHKHTYVGKE